MKNLTVSLALSLGLAAGGAGARPLPASAGAPDVGKKAPDFRLEEVGGKPVSLSEILSAGPKGSWVLLVFYRGYW